MFGVTTSWRRRTHDDRTLIDKYTRQCLAIRVAVGKTDAYVQRMGWTGRAPAPNEPHLSGEKWFVD